MQAMTKAWMVEARASFNNQAAIYRRCPMLAKVRRVASACFLAVLSNLLVSNPAVAGLSPETYARMQQRAPEHLQIEVLRVCTVRTHYKDATVVSVTVDARIRSVKQSASGLQAGQRISIRYDHCIRRHALIGPGEVPILEAGKTYPAFLEKSEGGAYFCPAAGGRSFSALSIKIENEKRA
jgi:hypothetical protein